MTIAFIGLGNMGFPMAKNLVDAGFIVKAYNRSPEKTEALQKLGAQGFADAAEAVRNADIIITMLSNDAAVKEVCEKIFSAMKPGVIHLSMSTISPATSTELLALHKKNNAEYLSSPVMGRPPAAEAKQLYILLSGSRDAREVVVPVLSALS
jgi:3-hydroxyisobutyrate dehydrogenase-like beta-hydroxyacid dehydrogenase